MATQTTNYGLKKPAYSDTADIGVINSNMDIIDAKMKEIDDKITNETDPTVPAWAKEPNKPTYTAEEVGALPSNTPIPDPTSVVVDRLVSVGTHIADISVNGEKTELYAPTGGGGTSVTIDSELSTTSKNPVQNKAVTQELNKKGTYSKPTGGIPKTDLASEVQTSLGKADTALQEHQDISGKAEKTEVTALFNSISDEWNPLITYAVGQYCIHNNILWKCLVANKNIEPTEGTHWTQTTIDAEIASVNSSLDYLKNDEIASVLYFSTQGGWLVSSSFMYYGKYEKATVKSGSIIGIRNLTSEEIAKLNNSRTNIANCSMNYMINDSTLSNALSGKLVRLVYSLS